MHAQLSAAEHVSRFSPEAPTPQPALAGSEGMQWLLRLRMLPAAMAPSGAELPGAGQLLAEGMRDPCAADMLLGPGGEELGEAVEVRG